MSYFEIDKELEIMCKCKLTAEEWLFTRLLLLAQHPENQRQYLHKYFVECHKIGLPRETISILQDKGIIDKSFKLPEKGKTMDLDSIKFSRSFINSYFRASSKLGQELFDNYPPYLNGPGGKILSARNITKVGFNDMPDFFYAYAKAIKFDRQYHDLILKSLEFAKDNGLIQYGIGEYYASRKWTEHIIMMEKDEIGEFSTKFDTIEAV